MKPYQCELKASSKLRHKWCAAGGLVSDLVDVVHGGVVHGQLLFDLIGQSGVEVADGLAESLIGDFLQSKTKKPRRKWWFENE